MQARKSKSKWPKGGNIVEAKAFLRYARISPRKVQIVIDLIRGKDYRTACAILKHTSKSACEPLLKLLNSAAANAEHLAMERSLSLDVQDLYVCQCFVTPGPTLKRIRPMAKGRAYRILKRTSHITIMLKEREEN
jgi:large subunit ribosomal protein L22